MDSCPTSDVLELRHNPFDIIPNELLALILIWTSNQLDNDKQRFEFPLTTPQLVSHRWRVVTLTTPALWTSVHVDTKMTTTQLEHYLMRSGNMSLSLVVPVCSEDFLSILQLHILRWEYVIMWINHRGILHMLLDNISQATSLRHFSCIVPTNLVTPRRTIGPLNPGIEYLQLTNLRLMWHPAPFSLQNLSNLVLRAKGLAEPDVDLQGLLETLNASPRLERLELVALFLPPEDLESWLKLENRPRTIELSNLRKLVIADMFISEFLFLSSLIQSPNLQSLGVGLFGTSPSWDPEIEWDALAPVYPSLDRLDIWSLPTDAADLLLAIRRVPPVSFLGIGASGTGWSASIYEDVKECFRQLPHLRESVHTLQVRRISINIVHSLLVDCFPKTETISIYYRDHRTLDGAATTFSSELRNPPKITSWGKQADEIWHLEGLQERESRLNHPDDWNRAI
ncbi:hypothetical protein FRC02_008289 [Tulasnella sp. 418]|nr:hypothetical protein FRC02_008289 [Tulasnella sp. 418]